CDCAAAATRAVTKKGCWAEVGEMVVEARRESSALPKPVVGLWRSRAARTRRAYGASGLRATAPSAASGLACFACCWASARRMAYVRSQGTLLARVERNGMASAECAFFSRREAAESRLA